MIDEFTRAVLAREEVARYIKASGDHVGSEAKDGTIQIECELDPKSPPALLEHGLTGELEIELERVAPVRLVLRESGARGAGANP